MQVKKCLYCEKEFEVDNRHPYKEYCCNKCWLKDYYKKKKVMIDRNCIICGKRYQTTERNLRKKFCSRSCQCRSQELKRHPVETIIKKCEFCGEGFSSRLKNNYKKFCSSDCANKSFQSSKYLKNPRYRFKDYINGAKARNLTFNISYNYFLEKFWHSNCTYCGVKIESAGIDRVDSSIGYEPFNCVPCCTTCNMMKQSQSTSDFFSHIQKIINHTAAVKPCDSIK